MGLTVCGTGHRPEDCEDESVVRLKVRLKLQKSDIDTFITGMAAGFDLWAGDEARLLGIPIVCARPWAKHKARKQDTELYQTLIDYADEVVVVKDHQTYVGPWVYHDRNEWMVDNSDAVLAYWNGKESGGTFACKQYAKKVKKPVTNIYDHPPF